VSKTRPSQVLCWRGLYVNVAIVDIKMAPPPFADNRAESSAQDYRQSYLAYVDILGWKNIVDQIGSDFDRFDAIIGAFNALQSHEVFDEFARDVAKNVPFNLPPPHHFVASDTIILSTSDDARSLFALVLSCGRLCADLLGRGFLTRGAIVRGKLYHKGRVIFGEALTNAYLTERRSTRYPRVVISEQAYSQLLTTGPLKGPWAEATYSNMFRRDQDGFWRLNPFANLFIPDRGSMADYLHDAAATIVRTLSEFFPGSEEFAKAHWLAEVFNAEHARIAADPAHNIQDIKPIDITSLRGRA